jgi:RimJ/RimL family protein N-acetyltransferase
MNYAVVLLWLGWAGISFSNDIPPTEPCGEVVSQSGFAHAELAPAPHMEALSKQAISIASGRLILRTPERGDLPFLLEMFSDYLTVRYTWFWHGENYWTLERVRAEYDGFAKKQLEGARRDFLIHLNDSEKTRVGRSAFFPGKGPGSWELGITLYRRYWGNRYAEDALRGMFRYAFGEMKAKEIWFRTEPENTPMLRQYEKFGIPKVIDAKEDVPEPPLYHRYHHFLLTKELWTRIAGKP